MTTLVSQIKYEQKKIILQIKKYINLKYPADNEFFYKEQNYFINWAETEGKSKLTSIINNNSINFTKAYFEVSSYIDRFNNTNLTKLINIELSKYSYPFLSIQRKRGIIPFLRYSKRLVVRTRIERI